MADRPGHMSVTYIIKQDKDLVRFWMKLKVVQKVIKDEGIFVCVLKVFLKKLKNILFFYFKLIFFIFLDYFDVLISKIIFKK